MRSMQVSPSEKENVLTRGGDFRVTIVPHLGGKIRSIQLKGRELLQAPLAPALPRTRDMLFEQSDASGWDECLPSVAACTVQGPSGPVAIPDHGDVWRVVWDHVAGDASRECLRATCFSLPLSLERTVALTETAMGWHLHLDYTVSNSSSHSVPWSWAAHPLFAVHAGDSIELPAGVTDFRVEGSAGGRLGAAGDAATWPTTKLADGSLADLSKVEPSTARIGDKLFTGPLDSASAWCVLHRPSAGLRIRVRFDAAKTPYLGLWLCYGGWPERPGPKQNCVAVEPATVPVDSLAQTGNWSRVLAPQASYSWHMSVDFELAERDPTHA